MASLHFQARIHIQKQNPYVLVTKDQIEILKPGWKKPLPVRVQVNGVPNPPWEINMMPVGNGDFYLYLHGDVRKVSATKVGDNVTVDVSYNPLYKNGPMHPMPSWFSSAIEAYSDTYRHWNALSPSRKKEVLRYFSRLKSQEAIHRNLQKVLHVLSGKSGRFMARDWKDGK